MRKTLFVIALILISSTIAEAGVAKFAAKHVVKPAAKHSAHVAKKVAKAAFKGVI